VWKHFTAAVIIDLIYEVIELRWIYPGQALIVAAVLALPSYLVIRGLANRIARLWLPAPLAPSPQIPTRKDHVDGSSL
jgi:hypothetical protein